MTDATCYEIYIRCPIDLKLLWESAVWFHRHNCKDCNILHIRRPKNKSDDVSRTYLAYCKKRKRKASYARMLKRILVNLFAKLLFQTDKRHGSYKLRWKYTSDYYRRLSIIRKMLLQSRFLFNKR